MRGLKRGRVLPLPARYAARAFPVGWLLTLVLGLFVLFAVLWSTMPPPLPSLPDDAQRFGDCTVNPQADGCGVWPD